MDRQHSCVQECPTYNERYPEDIIERFQHVISLGFDYFQVMFPGIGEDYIHASQMFADKVMKKL